MAGLHGLTPGALVALSILLLGCGADSTTSPVSGVASTPNTPTQDTSTGTNIESGTTGPGDSESLQTPDNPGSSPDSTPGSTPDSTPGSAGTTNTDNADQNTAPEESPVAVALRTGNALVVENSDDLISATIDQIEIERNRFNPHLQQLFALQSDNSPDADSLTAISWDPTHDAAMLIPTYGINTTALFTNSVTTDSNTLYEKSIAIIGEKPARYMAIGSNPMRNSHRNADLVSLQMHGFMRNAIDWLTNPATDDEMNIVIAHMDDSYYFPDETATRQWLDDNITATVSYNDADTCDDINLNQCLTAETDLLIISQILNENSIADNIAATVNNAMQNGIPVLYLHHDGGITDLGTALLNQLAISYELDNYWKRLQLSDFDITSHIGKTPQNIAAINTMLEHLRARDYGFDWGQCDGENCTDVEGLTTEFEDGATAVRSIMQTLDDKNQNIFIGNDHTVSKLLALTGDHLRQDVVFPMDKIATDDNTFLRSYFADHAVYYSRNINPPQPDMGNFSRSDFTHIAPIDKTISIDSKQPFRSTGLYALPGQPLTITRTDQQDVTVQIFVNTQRSGSTHQWATDGYKRPKFLQSPKITIKSGDTVVLTTPYGGPVQLAFDSNDIPVTLSFRNAGEHPHWGGTQDDTKFAQQLNAGLYDWAELTTPGFEVHSTLANMRDSVNNAKWGSAASLAIATMDYLHNFPHVLAGFQGPGIDTVAEIHDFAANKGFSVENIDKVKHMNADQATCGYGCSGNPYDAYWSYDPLGHGDLHELGHGLEKTRLRFDGWPGHASTNHYSYYTKSQYYKTTGGDPECQSLPFSDMFTVLQTGISSDDPQSHIQQNLWDTMGWSQGAAMIIQMMMTAQDNGALTDGWHLLARLHIVEREFSRALSSEDQWAAMQQKLGMDQYSLADAKTIARNDWLLIALGVTTDLDWRSYLTTWGITYSTQAAAQAALAGYRSVPAYYYVSSGDGYCKGEGFNGQKLPLDGVSTWP